MKMQINFCRRCGAPLQAKGEGTFLCANGHHVYYKSSVAAGLLLLNDRNEILLGVRALEPDKGRQDVPGGFCNWAETFEAAVIREIQEELGLQPTEYTTPQFLVHGIDYYTYEGEDGPVMNALFWARTTREVAFTASDDIASAQWIPLAAVDMKKFAPNFKTGPIAIRMLQDLVLREGS